MAESTVLLHMHTTSTCATVIYVMGDVAKNVVIEDAKPEEKRKGEKENPLKSEEKGVEKQEGNKVN